MKQEIKERLQRALESEYGFYPAKKDIEILESNINGTYVIFEVKENKYKFKSDYFRGKKEYGVWCGKGTISRIE